MTGTTTLKTIPYGKTNFRSIRQDNFAYVDKTRYIEVLETYASEFPFIVRPRRFGKTLFTQMLEAYYDEIFADEFEKNFAGTYIGEHKTNLASSFRVIHFDFSGISASEDIRGSFFSKVRNSVTDYFERYPHPKQEEILKSSTNNAADFIGAFFELLNGEFSRKIYVIIDEYDQFANDILSADIEEFKKITSGHESYYKAFFTRLKEATQGPVARIFITGVSAFSLDSMTSGFNIADKISTPMRFAGMFGFNESELRNLIQQVVDLEECGLTLDYVFNHMKEWYNGYRFSYRSSETVFNPTVCLYYLNFLRREQAKPSFMLDSNLGQNLDKIRGILSLGNPTLVKDILDKAMNGIPIPFDEDASELNLNQSRGMGERELLSALFYLGFLTYDGGNEPALCIPNRAVRIQFFEYFLKYVIQVKFEFTDKVFKKTLRPFAEGNPEPFFSYICNRYSDASGIHTNAHLRESDFQSVLVSAFILTDLYDVQSEYEVLGAESKGYADILVTPKKECTAKYSYLIEIKHLKAEEGKNAALLEKTVAEAKAQLARYGHGKNIDKIDNLKRIVAVFVGVDLKVLEAFD